MTMLHDAILREFAQNRVGIQEFSESSDYCNKPLFPRQRVLLKLIFLEEMDGYEEDVLTQWLDETHSEVILSPLVRERRAWLVEHGYKHFPEVIMVGGRRSSKGYVTGIAMSKLLFDMQQMGDPGSHYGIDPDKEIYFTCVAASLDQAKKFQFADFVSTVARCKPLIPHVPKFQEESFSVHTDADRKLVADLKRQGIPVGRDWSKLRAVPLAANADTIRGSASMAVVFDEMAFMLPGESRSSAEQCYNAAKPALDQFGRDGMMFLNSSPYTKIGKFYDQWDLSMQVQDDKPLFPGLLSIQFPSWELYRDYDKDPQRRFKGAVMVSPDWDRTNMNPDDMAKARAAEMEEKADPETFKVERRGQWAEVMDAFLNPAMVDRAFTPTFRGKPIEMTYEGNYSFSYYGHCDPSSTTAGFGCALAHVEEFDNDDGEKEKHVVFDFVKRWNPKSFPGETIDYMQVQAEIMQYIVLFDPYAFTFDQFNSKAPIQWLRQEIMKRRRHCRVYEKTATKSTNWHLWSEFRTALNLGLVHIPADCPDSTLANLELKFLQEVNGKVEKQELGPVTTKDIADCIATCSVALIGDVIRNVHGELGGYMAMGAERGFQIGGRDPSGPRSFPEFYAQIKKSTGMNNSRAASRGIQRHGRRP